MPYELKDGGTREGDGFKMSKDQGELGPDADGTYLDWGPTDFWLPDLGHPPDSFLCEEGLTWCDGLCVDLNSDPEHCGGCDTGCVVTDSCFEAVCIDKVCGKEPADDGTPCPEGTCYKGTCCMGCWDGFACKVGNSGQLCGTAGEECKVCPSSSHPCQKATCIEGMCALVDKPTGDPCPEGACLNGTCCEGCISGNACLAGDSTYACGIEGAECAECPTSTICAVFTCVLGNCVAGVISDTLPCPGGICVSGDCCTGCTESTGADTLKCHVSQDDQFCGIGGGECKNCMSGSQFCVAGLCLN